MVSNPNLGNVHRSLRSLDTVIVQDLFVNKTAAFWQRPDNPEGSTEGYKTEDINTEVIFLPACSYLARVARIAATSTCCATGRRCTWTCPPKKSFTTWHGAPPVEREWHDLPADFSTPFKGQYQSHADDLEPDQDERTRRRRRTFPLRLHQISMYALRQTRLHVGLPRKRDFAKRQRCGCHRRGQMRRLRLLQDELSVQRAAYRSRTQQVNQIRFVL